MKSLETKHPRTTEPPRQRGTLLLTLAAYLLGVVTTVLLLRGEATSPSPATLAVLVAVGLSAVAAVWAYRAAVRRRRHDERAAAPARPRSPRPASVGQDLPTVTDYYENAADGVMTPQAPHRWEPLPPEPDLPQAALPPGNRQPAMG